MVGRMPTCSIKAWGRMPRGADPFGARWRHWIPSTTPALSLRAPPGRFQGHDVRSPDGSEAVGAHAAGTLSDEELDELAHVASPGAGACGGQFTANTMAMAFEMLGISPMTSAMVPAQDPSKAQAA